jgi:hypothetical protein
MLSSCIDHRRKPLEKLIGISVLSSFRFDRRDADAALHCRAFAQATVHLVLSVLATRRAQQAGLRLRLIAAPDGTSGLFEGEGGSSFSLRQKSLANCWVSANTPRALLWRAGQASRQSGPPRVASERAHVR